jgi:crossover junction endodeoxyribonuclease RuvC
VTACVVGLDLSLTSTGIATIHRDDSITLRGIGSKGRAGATLPERRHRLDQLGECIVQHVLDASPHLVVIEAPAFSRTTGHQHDRSGLWWLVVNRLVLSRFVSGPTTVVEASGTSRCKYATGKGNAHKDQVLAAVVRRYTSVEVTGNDTADALILAAMGRRWLGHPIETSLPNTHLAAMDGVHWPERVTA